MKWFFWMALFLHSCSSVTESDFRCRAEKIIKEMISTLENVETHEELQSASLLLKKQYKKLSELLLDVRAFREKYPEKRFSLRPLEESEELFVQLARLYEIPGCREIMERAQGDAVYLLLKSR